VEDRKNIWTALLKAERKARSTKVERLKGAPVKYPLLMGYNKVLYPLLKRGVFVHAKTFFGIRIKTLLPAGTDILLNGIKSHDSEIRLTKFLTRNLQEGDTFIDVGAHYGYYTLLASAMIGERGHVYSIEASAHSFGILRENTKSRRNILIYHNAAGEAPGEIVFYEYPGPLAEYNTIVKGAYADKAWIRNVKQTINKVQTVVLDDLIKANQISKAVIKIDVEGGELSVIKGLASSLDQCDLTIVMEYLLSDDLSSPHHQAVGLLVANGYKAHAIDAEGNLKALAVIDQYLKDSGLDSDNLVFVKA
jgi:FkbM family methyltransferase